MSGPKVLVIAGYFDWFSGYQEVGLARALSKRADVCVLAGDRVSPIFSDSHLERLGIERRYGTGVTVEEEVTVKRLPVHELRSMVWSGESIRAVEAGAFDLIVQVMPGQLLPVAGTLAKAAGRRVALYGDNAAMYAALPPWQQHLKFLAFSATKGVLYSLVNSRADAIYGYTPHTIDRLHHLSVGREMKLLPLAFDPTQFYPDETLRRRGRELYGWRPDTFAVIAPGKVQSQKKFDVLLRVVHEIRQQGTDLRLAFVGLDDKEASRTLREQVKDLNMGDYTLLKDFCTAPELLELFNAADLGVWPAMPAITIQQAMGTGLRVLLPDNDLVKHLPIGADAGTCFPEGGDLTQALCTAIAAELVRGSRDAHWATREQRAEANEWLSTEALASELLSPLRPQGAAS